MFGYSFGTNKSNVSYIELKNRTHSSFVFIGIGNVNRSIQRFRNNVTREKNAPLLVNEEAVEWRWTDMFVKQ